MDGARLVLHLRTVPLKKILMRDMHKFQGWVSKARRFFIKWVLFGVVFPLLLLVWFFHAARYDQLRPHTIRYYVAGELVSSVVITNPAYINAWTDEFGVHRVETNYYWDVWPMFR
jgi:hypothetical protein